MSEIVVTEGWFVCQDCKEEGILKEFRWESELLRHILRSHSGLELFSLLDIQLKYHISKKSKLPQKNTHKFKKKNYALFFEFFFVG